MQRLSIGRLLRSTLVGLTLVLAAIAALGVASLYSSRQSYENTLLTSSQLSGAAANLATASVVVEEIASTSRGRQRPSAAERQTALAYRDAARRALAVAADDPISLALVHREIDAPSADRALAVAGTIEQRQLARERAARSRAQTRSRDSLLIIALAGLIALAGALGLVALLIRSMRGPLDSLVAATQAMARGDLRRRVDPDGPRELRQLSDAFNRMGDELDATTAGLERERAKLATTIASLDDALVVTEPDSTTIATVNPRVAELMPELAPGGRVDAPGGPLPTLDALAGGELTVEHRGRTLAVTAARLGGTGAPDGTVWTIRDMTEWARLDRAKSEFIATASHELRSPLTSIKGFIELLANAPEGMSARQREFLSIVLRSTDRLVDLVNDLLDVARLESDQVSIDRRAVDVGELIYELAELMGPRVSARDQHLEIRIAPGLPLAQGDPSRLRQIIQNLLTNAHVYTPEGGRLLIGADAHDPYVRVSVSDTGSGLGAEQLDHIYDRFYRAGNDHSAPGTGLGLSIVKSLVDRHHGRIEVASEVGRGTTFRISIPMADGPGSAPGRSRVLVVARESMRATLEPALEARGISYEWETSGVGAARACGERRFEVALIDTGLANPRGVIGALHLRGRRTRRTVILLTEAKGVPDGLSVEGLTQVALAAAPDALAAALAPSPAPAEGGAGSWSTTDGEGAVARSHDPAEPR